MLPANSVEGVLWSGIVAARPDRGREDTGETRTVSVGSKDTRGGGRAVRAGVHTHRAHQLAHRAAGRRRPDEGGDRLVGPPWTRPGREGLAAFPARGSGRAGAAQAHRATTLGDDSLA